jgi:hypothetical protein
LIGLFAASALCGLFAAWVFRRFTNIAALRATLRQIHAHFLEFRLFFDEPRLIWRAQKDLIKANLRFCALLLPPALILALPMTWLTIQLDAIYGTAPLHTGEAAIVTAQLATDLQPEDAQDVLEAPKGIAIETPPVRIVNDRQITWRIRPLRPVDTSLSVTLRGVTLTKSIKPGRRERPLLAFLIHPEESRLPAGSVVWLGIDSPEKSHRWIVWFLAISTATALAAMRWFL